MPRTRIPTTILLLAAACLTLMALTSCSSSDAEENDSSKLTISGRNGAKATIIYELADDEAERQKGLSGRQYLDPGAGMLFVLDDRHAGFWMKDTLIPLSVAFISRCGEIVHIAEMQPLSLEIHNTPRDYALALEANAGWFARYGMTNGDRVELPSALRPADC